MRPGQGNGSVLALPLRNGALESSPRRICFADDAGICLSQPKLKRQLHGSRFLPRTKAKLFFLACPFRLHVGPFGPGRRSQWRTQHEAPICLSYRAWMERRWNVIRACEHKSATYWNPGNLAYQPLAWLLGFQLRASAPLSLPVRKTAMAPTTWPWPVAQPCSAL